MSSINLEQVMATAATGLSAQSIRMNTIASNLANAGNVGSTEEGTYHAQFPIFQEITKKVSTSSTTDDPNGGVEVTRIDHTTKPLEKRYEPTNPMANKDGYIFVTDVNPIAEMTNMISASKEYQANVEVMNTIKNMMMQGINILNSK